MTSPTRRRVSATTRDERRWHQAGDRARHGLRARASGPRDGGGCSPRDLSRTSRTTRKSAASISGRQREPGRSRDPRPHRLVRFGADPPWSQPDRRTARGRGSRRAQRRREVDAGQGPDGPAARLCRNDRPPRRRSDGNGFVPARSSRARLRAAGARVFGTLSVEENVRVGEAAVARVAPDAFDRVYELFPILRTLPGAVTTERPTT